jgi:translation initiation factor 2D
MYKKNVTVSSHHVLGGKDAKQLKAQLVKLYGGVLKDDQLSSLLPGKAGIVQSKLSNRSVVYAIEGGNPMFFDPDGRGAVLLPTVSATRKCRAHVGASHKPATP